MAKRIAVLVSGGGTNLQALIDAQQRGELGGGEIAAVISSKAGAYALERAKNAGIPGFVLPRKEFASNQAMTIALVEMLKGMDIDLVVLAGCMIIFTEELVEAYPNAIINVHPALIPQMKQMPEAFPADCVAAYEQVGGTPHLDFRHTVFGQVYAGMEVVDAIAAVKTDGRDKPLEDVTILGIDVQAAE